MSTLTTVVELPDSMRSPLHRELNRGMMVRWINQNLATRAANDVRDSIVFYDIDGDFLLAAPASTVEILTQPARLEGLAKTTRIRFYTVGI